MERRELAIFDLDDTLISGQSHKWLMLFLRRKKLFSFAEYLSLFAWFFLYKARIVNNVETVMEKAYKFLKDHTREEINSLLEEFFDNDLKKRFYDKTINIINNSRKHGQQTLLLSNAPKILLNIIAGHLGIDYYIGTEVEEKNGIYTGKILKFMYGAKRVDEITQFCDRRNILLKDCFLYTDHYSDIPLLKIVGQPVAVNPDSKLAAFAKKMNFPIIITQ